MEFRFQSLAPFHAPCRVALGIGVFDGVHLGHRKLLDELCSIARAADALPVALTFAPHPRTVLEPHRAPTLLYSVPERVALLKAAGAAAVEVVSFDRALANVEPEEFLLRLCSDPGTEIAGFCVGAPWRFGAHGNGDAAVVREFAARSDRAFAAVEQLKINGELVSSSAIRRAVASGLLDKARTMLGRRYTLSGRVVHGHRAASGELGFPTANLEIAAGVLPPDGVYAALAHTGGETHLCAVNIGLSPTFAWSEHCRRIEAHLFDFSGELYDDALSLELVAHLRSERAFAGVEELKKQIASDIEQIRNLINGQVQNG